MTNEADSSVVLADLQVTLFRECNNHSPVLQILLQSSVKKVMVSPPA